MIDKRGKELSNNLFDCRTLMRYANGKRKYKLRWCEHSESDFLVQFLSLHVKSFALLHVLICSTRVLGKLSSSWILLSSRPVSGNQDSLSMYVFFLPLGLHCSLSREHLLRSELHPLSEQKQNLPHTHKGRDRTTREREGRDVDLMTLLASCKETRALDPQKAPPHLYQIRGKKKKSSSRRRALLAQKFRMWCGGYEMQDDRSCLHVGHIENLRHERISD